MVAVFLALAGPIVAQDAALRLSAWFGDHMVLPRETSVPLTGRARAGAEVLVTTSWSDAEARTRVGADGRFTVALRTPVAGGPHEFAVRCGDQRIAVRDALVGDVWLGSGQSNMQMAVGPMGGWQNGVADWQQEVAAARHEQLRLFTVGRRAAAAPVDEVEGEWQVCSPESVKAFSATAYFFGRRVQRESGIPIGLVVASWGGTVIEAWMRDRALAPFTEFADAVASLRVVAGSEDVQARAFAGWWQQVAQQEPRSAEDPRHDDAAWREVALPHAWSQHELASFDGIAWYRRRVEIPAAWAGRELLLQLGAIDDMDTVWFAGERVGGRELPGHARERREYRIPARLVAAGPAVLAVRVVDTGGEGGILGDAEAMRLSPVAGEGGSISLADGWRFARGAELRRLPTFPRRVGDEPNVPTVLWNGMVAPLASFPFRGVLWYQGESNRLRAEQYSRLFPAMIEDWRAAFGRELPFYFVQIAPYGYGGDTGEAFALRLAQQAALRLPATGMAVTVDIGDPGDIHPTDKQTVGDRLARLALRDVYGRGDLVADGPVLRSVRAADGSLRIEFGNAEDGLRTRGDGPGAFEIAGEDGVFHPARARIDGGAVVLRADAVPAPVHARYCHAAAAAGTVWNAAGLPLAPFAASAR